jgi:hypothetical protein
MRPKLPVPSSLSEKFAGSPGSGSTPKRKPGICPVTTPAALREFWRFSTVW